MDRHSAVTRSYEIPGQTWPSELCWLYDNLAASKNHAEIGIYCGRSLFSSCGGMQGATVYAVDLETIAYPCELPPPSIEWFQAVRDVTLEAIRKLNQSVEVNFSQNGSLATARLLQSRGVVLDSVFIDGGHEYEYVLADIQAWKPLVRQGGLIAGHDYWTVHVGVMRAVNECFAGEFQIVPNTRIWYVRR